MHIDSEILLQLISGGLEGDIRKVKAYAYMIAANYEYDKNNIEAERIFEILKIKGDRKEQNDRSQEN